MIIAMQYSFTLPSDYDMSVIERRVAEKGHALDEHAPLAFKAYLVARRGDPLVPGREHLYAPFYLWRDCAGLSDFLASPGFAGLAATFGWPRVRTWPAVMAMEQGGDLAAAAFASREIRQIPPFSDLDALRHDEHQLSCAALQEEEALLALSAFEPTTWTLVRFRLWRDPRPLSGSPGTQAYRVLHVSDPARRQRCQERG